MPTSIVKGIAQRYLKLKWSIIPVKKKSKIPVGKWEKYQKQQATTEEVDTWFKKYKDFNLAVVTGAISGIIVVDIDEQAGWDWLRDNKCNIPVTPQACTTPNEDGTPKKVHIYFRHPGSRVKTSIKKIPGIDIKGDDAYVLVPPSLHEKGHNYQWLPGLAPWETDIADVPPWLRGHLTFDTAHDTEPAGAQPVDALQETEQLIGPSWVQDLLKGVSKGQRNDAIARLAGRYLGLGLTEEEVTDLLLTVNRKNTPPLADKEVKTIVKSIARAEMSRQTHLPGEEATSPPLGEKVTEKVRSEVLEGLSKRLKIGISEIQRVSGDEVKYVFLINGHKAVMTISQITSFRQFKNKMFEVTQTIIPKIKTDHWDSYLQRIADVAIDVDPGPEASMEGILEGLLVNYIENHPPEGRYAESHGPFFEDGRINIFLTNFADYIKVRHSISMNINNLAQRLRMLGAEQRFRKLGGKPRRYWAIPTKLTGFTDNELREFEKIAQEESA